VCFLIVLLRVYICGVCVVCLCGMYVVRVRV